MKYLFLILLFISGCSYQNLNTNKVSLIYDNICLVGGMSPYDKVGTPLIKRQPDLWSIGYSNYIDNHSLPIEFYIDIYIEMADGTKCYAPDLMDIKVAQKYASSEIRSGSHFDYFKEWSVKYILGERWYVIYDSQDRLLAFSSIDYPFNEKKSKRPAFWNKANNMRFLLPLSYNSVVELFGEPDNVFERKAFY